MKKKIALIVTLALVVTLLGGYDNVSAEQRIIPFPNCAPITALI